MTSLVIDELITELSQDINVKTKIKLSSIKWRFYVHNMPAGTFFFEVWNNGELYAVFPFSSNTLRNSFGGTSDYFWVVYPFGVNSHMSLHQGLYTFKITCSGYTYSASSFIGVCKDWSGYFGQPLEDNVEFTEHPYSFRLIERRQREL